MLFDSQYLRRSQEQKLTGEKMPCGNNAAHGCISGLMTGAENVYYPPYCIGGSPLPRPGRSFGNIATANNIEGTI